jgi:hypothetical protein
VEAQGAAERAALCIVRQGGCAQACTERAPIAGCFPWHWCTPFPAVLCVLCCVQGSVLRCDVQGRLVMKTFLSGMPDIKLGLNDKLEVGFWSCVILWEQLD